MSELEAEISKIFIPDDLKAYINGLVEIKVEKALRQRQVGDRLITRAQIIEESSRRVYDYGVRKKLLNPIATEGRNAQHYVFRSEYEAFLRHLQINRNS